LTQPPARESSPVRQVFCTLTPTSATSQATRSLLARFVWLVSNGRELLRGAARVWGGVFSAAFCVSLLSLRFKPLFLRRGRKDTQRAAEKTNQIATFCTKLSEAIFPLPYGSNLDLYSGEIMKASTI